MSFFDEIIAPDGTYKYLVNGEWKVSASGKTVDILNPSKANAKQFKVQACSQSYYQRDVHSERGAHISLDALQTLVASHGSNTIIPRKLLQLDWCCVSETSPNFRVCSYTLHDSRLLTNSTHPSIQDPHPQIPSEPRKDPSDLHRLPPGPLSLATQPQDSHTQWADRRAYVLSHHHVTHVLASSTVWPMEEGATLTTQSQTITDS
eukprot:1188054-Prorocentrum_minimum.AAC.2